MRGDRPAEPAFAGCGHKFTPHARGSTVLAGRLGIALRVYPACAGIDLDRLVSAVTSAGLPRMRGDRPDTVFVVLVKAEFTPHARGSTPLTLAPHPCYRVYPACAGIDPGAHRSQGD